MRVSSTLPVQPAALLPSSNLQKAPEIRTSSCTCHCTLGGPVPSSSARYTTTDVSCRVRGGPTVILYSNIQKGELRKSEAVPMFKVYACQPLSTTGTLTHKGPSRKPVSSKFPNAILLTIAYPQRNIHPPPLRNTASAKHSKAATQNANSHSTVLPRKTKRQETKVLEEHFFHACNLISPILMVALLLRELAFFKTQQRY